MQRLWCQTPEQCQSSQDSSRSAGQVLENTKVLHHLPDMFCNYFLNIKTTKREGRTTVSPSHAVYLTILTVYLSPSAMSVGAIVIMSRIKFCDHDPPPTFLLLQEDFSYHPFHQSVRQLVLYPRCLLMVSSPHLYKKLSLDLHNLRHYFCL